MYILNPRKKIKDLSPCSYRLDRIEHWLWAYEKIKHEEVPHNSTNYWKSSRDDGKFFIVVVSEKTPTKLTSELQKTALFQVEEYERKILRAIDVPQPKETLAAAFVDPANYFRI